MSIERRLKKLEDRAPKTGFPLVDGSHFTYDPSRYGIEMFLATMEATVADGDGRSRPPIPPLLRAISQAKNRRRALSELYPEWEYNPPMVGYDLEILVETGELVAVPLVRGYPAQQPSPEGTVNKLPMSPEADDYEEALKRFNRRAPSTPAEANEECFAGTPRSTEVHCGAARATRATTWPSAPALTRGLLYRPDWWTQSIT